MSENTGYHHGEVSLVQTIIGLAQNFVGSNNINILKPNGAFGSRATGGKDAAAARYIFTELNDITKAIFNPLDNPIYNYVQDDEQTVEPQWYLPVLPMILVNGAEGIGTGWSTNIPSFDPKDIVANLRRLMNNEPLEEMTPWYKGWEGVIEPMGQQKYKITGRIEQIDSNTVEITEIPVKTWTNTVKEFLLAGFGNEKTPAWIKDMEEHHTTNIRFIVKLSDAEMEKALRVGLLEKFKLVSSVSLGNMVAFDPYGRIKKYNDVFEILKDFYYVRLEYYEKRKNHMLEMLQRRLLMISEQARFVKMIIEKELSVANKKKKELIELLEKHDFTKFTKDGKPVESKGSNVFIDENDSEEEIENEGDVSALNLKEAEDRVEGEHKPDTIFSSYDYLLGMTIWSLTHERYVRLLNEKSNLQKELEVLIGKSAVDLWNHDLDEFMAAYEAFLAKDAEEREHLSSSGNKKKTTRKRKAAKSDAADPVKKVKLEGEAQVALNGSKVRTTQAKPKSTSAEKATTPSNSSTPAPKDVTVKKEPNDILSFFSPSSKTKSTEKTSKSSKPSKPVTSSIFDSDDDIFEVSKPSEKAKSKPKQSIMDELDDLEILGDKPEVLESRKRSSRPARAKITTVFSDDESDVIEDDPSEVIEIDDDDEYEDE